MGLAMGYGIFREPIEVTEPVAIQDDFASGVGPLEPLGSSNVRLCFYVDHKHSGVVEHETVAKVVMANESLPALARAIIRYLDENGMRLTGPVKLLAS
jgi:hypothetical protein